MADAAVQAANEQHSGVDACGRQDACVVTGTRDELDDIELAFLGRGAKCLSGLPGPHALSGRSPHQPRRGKKAASASAAVHDPPETVAAKSTGATTPIPDSTDC